MNTPNQDRRSQRARQAILDAALEICREKGLGKASMEEIARRAGVGKQTIYRWWPSKAAVVQEAINEAAGDVTDFPDTGDVRADLRTQMTAVVTLLANPRFTPFTSLIGVAQDDPEAARAFLEGIVEPRVQACRERLRRAQEQGQLRTDADLDDVVELLYAPLYYRALLRNRPVAPEQVDEVLKLAFAGLAPVASQ
ncbi:TetR/AcrR family transcriptional regulator [Rugosimonospora africana]|uniref:TetR family transcriptional regulator n=1 Tax=Rugosimonospora africana TaxID=556532 RepID=A0A8J3VVK6_9ACTN|nr:TetR/AcrR family transcriptional regulator [Rugosimonospora africana]GIH19813.1 TetR family transcriptional regulator [Rugosimonospora africana]